MGSDHLGDSLPRERLLTEPTLDRTKHLSVRSILFVEKLTQSMIRRAEAIAEVLRENPTAIYVRTMKKK